MIKQTHEEWKNEAEQRFGKSPIDWKFRCPACGHVATGSEFRDLGASPNDMAQECIGRINGKGTKNQTDEGYGCNWAAYGLLGTLGKGRMVIMPDGHEVPVFDFA